MQPLVAAIDAIDRSRATLGALGAVLQPLLLVCAAALFVCALVPTLRPWLRRALAVAAGVLGAGEIALMWFHWRLYGAAAVVDPFSGLVTGHLAVPPWVESEKLYVWALILAVLALAARRHGDELRPWLAVIVAALVAGAVLWGHPFTDPLPDALGQYRGYVSGVLSGDPSAAAAAFQGMEGARRFYYNTWYMWLHPPLLFFSYGAFVASFAAIVLMIRHRHATYESTAYRWARLGYLPLTLGMLVGFPWAILAWSGESWWWSGKVNMSIMMWLLYTAYLHARLYLRRRGMWKVVAALAVLSFVALLLTYLTTYVVPGAHSVAG